MESAALANVIRTAGLHPETQDAGIEWLAATLNGLILHDFDRLISILYRLDINEQKLKALLKENPGNDAGMLIANMMVAREQERVRSRTESKDPAPNESDEERW